VPDVAPVGPSGQQPQIDPFPYEQSTSPPHSEAGYGNFDPYSHAPMQMPDARNYMASGGYPGYGMEGGYGVAAAGAGAGAAGVAGYEAGRDRDFQSEYSESTSHTSGGPSGSNSGNGSMAPLTPAAVAKQREAQAERDRNRMSMTGYGNQPSGSAQGQYGQYPGESQAPAAPSSPPLDGDRRTSAALSDGGRSTIYQHTDMGSVPDEGEEEGPSEIPPK
jgi:hypothetical protein